MLLVLELLVYLTGWDWGKIPAFCIHFQSISLHEKYFILIKMSLEFDTKGLINHNPAFGSEHGLVLNKQWAITWTSVDFLS